jgi:hypothetical protein
MVTGLRMMRPSLTSFRMVWRELALEISFTSLGSSQILFFPHPMTEAARRFWVRRLTLHQTSSVIVPEILLLVIGHERGVAASC